MTHPAPWQLVQLLVPMITRKPQPFCQWGNHRSYASGSRAARAVGNYTTRKVKVSASVMENGDPVTQLLAGPAGRVYLIFGFQPRASGNGASHQLPGVGVAPTILLIIWLQA